MRAETAAVSSHMKAWLRAALLSATVFLSSCCDCGINSTTSVKAGPAITSQPQSLTVSDGQPAMFSVVATGTAPIGYQWWRGGTQIPGATAATFTISAGTLADSGAQFAVVVTDASGSLASDRAILTVTAIAPVVITQPSTQTVPVGANAVFSVLARGGSAGLSYQWMKSGVAIPGATAASYVTPLAVPADDRSMYSVVVSDAAGSIMSAAATLNVTHTMALLAGKIGGVGNIDGTGAGAAFHYPAGLAVDAGGTVYVADTVSQTIRRISATAVVTTMAGTANASGYTDSAGLSARFNNPRAVAVDGTGNVYVADAGNHAIRKISPAGIVTTLAGNGLPGFTNGTGFNAQFNNPRGVAVDGAGSVYVADAGNNVIRKVSAAGVVTTFAGSGVAGSANGVGALAQFNYPSGVAVDAAGNVYVAELLNSDIRRITPLAVVSTLAGTAGNFGRLDGIGAAASFRGPTGLAVDSAGTVLYIADYGNNSIRHVMIATGAVTTWAGSTTGVGGAIDAVGTAARFLSPSGTGIDPAGIVYVADLANNLIRRAASTAAVSTFAGSTGGRGFVDGIGGAARFNYVAGVASDAAGNVYVADFRNNAIRRISTTGSVATVAGTGGPGYIDGQSVTAQFNGPNSVGVDSAGNVYVADFNNFVIRRITPAGAVSTFAGSGAFGSADGTGAAAQFGHPYGLAVDAVDNIYVTDVDNNTIRKITPAGVVTTLAGAAGQAGYFDAAGAVARFWIPRGVATDIPGNVYVAEAGNNTVRKITPAGQVSTLAGLAGAAGAQDGVGGGARFNTPSGLTVDSIGNIYVADFDNHCIRQISAGGVVTTVAGVASSVGVSPLLTAGPITLPGSLNGPIGSAVLAGSVPGTIVRLLVAENTESAVLVVTLP